MGNQQAIENDKDFKKNKPSTQISKMTNWNSTYNLKTYQKLIAHSEIDYSRR